MSPTPDPAYTVFEIQPLWVLEAEALGSKEKFWYRARPGEAEWLFKFPQANTGQHWAEKVAAEVAACLEMPHAKVEFAAFQGTVGSASESFTTAGWNLFHGNQMLAGKVIGYDPETRFRQSDHTLANIFLALDRTFLRPEGRAKAKGRLAEYLVLDALIGNTDRHHENWGILRRQTQDRWTGMLAPTFDHASSLGRELLDAGPGKCRAKLLAENRLAAYAEKARGAIYWRKSDPHGLSPLELVRRGLAEHDDLFRPALAKLHKVRPEALEAVLARVPEGFLSPLARQFAIALMCYNIQELRKL